MLVELRKGKETEGWESTSFLVRRVCVFAGLCVHEYRRCTCSIFLRLVDLGDAASRSVCLSVVFGFQVWHIMKSSKCLPLLVINNNMQWSAWMRARKTKTGDTKTSQLNP